MKFFFILLAIPIFQFKRLFLICIFILLISLNHIIGATRTASISGNWSNPNTWGNSAVPGSTDLVIINTGVTVTLDVDATCAGLGTGKISGTAAIDGSKTLTTGILRISYGENDQDDVMFSIGTGTTLVCTSIEQISGYGNATASLTVSGTLKNSGTTSKLTTFTCNPGSTIEYNGGAQIVFATSYSNLTLSGSGTKTITGIIVNGILSLEAMASVVASPTFGSEATLQYNKPGTFTTGSEWTSPFSGSGGIIIKNNGRITTNGGKTLSFNVSLNICSGSTLATGTAAGSYLVIGGTTMVSGTLILANSSQKEFKGNVIITSSGTWSETGVANITFGDDLKNDGLYSSTNTRVHTFKGTDKKISGVSPIEITDVSFTDNYTIHSMLAASKLAIASGFTLTNNGIITAKASLTTINGSTGLLYQGPSGVLNIGGTSLLIIDATSIGNTVNYLGTGSQIINPTTYHHLSISGSDTKIINGPVICNGTITIDGALTVESTGDITNNGSMVINSHTIAGGSLIIKGNNTETGITNCTFNRNLDFIRWYILSSPIKSSLSSFRSLNCIETADGEYNFAQYDEGNNAWNYYNVSEIENVGNFIPGNGYLAGFPTGGLKSFGPGILNYGNISTPITTSSNNGWNAVGNPYSSALKIKGAGGFIAVNKKTTMPTNDILSDSYAAIYVWNETGNYTDTDGNYQYYKAIGNSGYLHPGIGEINQEYIQPGQGFLVNVKTDGNIIFNNSMQGHQSYEPLKSAEVSWPGITLIAESGGQTRSTVAAFNEMMSSGLDISYDAGLLASDYFQVYTKLVGGGNPVEFAIQCLPDHQYSELSIPVGIDLPEGGELVFKASGIILPVGLYLIIEDKELNIQTPLKTEFDYYRVLLDKNTFGIGRFYLSFGSVATEKQALSKGKIFTGRYLNNYIILEGTVERGSKARLFDLCGRQLGQYSLANMNRNEIHITGLDQPVYLLKVEGKNQSQVIKIITVKY